MSEDEKMSRIEAVKKALMAKHSGENVAYVGCNTNCGGGCCVLKIRLKDGKVVAIEPDDRYNPGVGVEDRVVSDSDLQKNRLQQRGCPMAWVWHKQIHHPNRVLYPLKRVEGSKRGEGRFERISWDEAITIIAEKMKEMKEKYGPYSILVPYHDTPALDYLFSHFGAGVQGWGWCSQDAQRLARHLMVGYPGWDYSPYGNDMADMLLNSKMIVLWGADPTVTHYGPAHQCAYYIKLARERGTPVICIDPCYTDSAAVLADQWIPIKPGTDAAMILAMAYIIFKEDLYNKEFCAKHVEPEGLNKWKKYVLGEEGGLAKTPEWAEEICGVPAETIVEFTRLYARMKPTYLWVNWSVARKSYGENVARAAAALQAIMGYFGKGGYHTFTPGSRDVPFIKIWYPAAPVPYSIKGKYEAPKMYRSLKWAHAVLLLDKVKSGELTTEEYRRIIGWRADPNLPNPNPKMLWRGGSFAQGTNFLVTGADSTQEQIKALEKMEFVVMMATHMTPTAKYADIILPVPCQTLEEPRFSQDGYGGFANITLSDRIVEPPGEVRDEVWVYTKIAEKLGFPHLFNRYYTTDENWRSDWEKHLKRCYEMAKEALEKRDSVKLPDWSIVREKRVLNVDEYYDEPGRAFVEELERGKPFPTESGKIEIYSKILADESQREKVHYDWKGRLIDNLPNDWRDLQPIPVYQPMVGGFEDPKVAKYPLLMLTPHPRYRVHSTLWDIPWLRGDVYRHAVWMNVADAKKRGIKDGDIVRVYNDVGETRLPAYVTARIMPGVVFIHHGAWYEPDENGVDRGGCPAVLLHDDRSPTTSPHVTALVQIEKEGE